MSCKLTEIQTKINAEIVRLEGDQATKLNLSKIKELRKFSKGFDKVLSTALEPKTKEQSIPEPKQFDLPVDTKIDALEDLHTNMLNDWMSSESLKSYTELDKLHYSKIKVLRGELESEVEEGLKTLNGNSTYSDFITLYRKAVYADAYAHMDAVNDIRYDKIADVELRKKLNVDFQAISDKYDAESNDRSSQMYPQYNKEQQSTSKSEQFGPREATPQEKQELKELEQELKAKEAKLSQAKAKETKAKEEALKAKEEEANLLKEAEELEIKRKAKEIEAEALKLKAKIKADKEAKILANREKAAKAKAERQTKVVAAREKALSVVQSIIDGIKKLIKAIVDKIKTIKGNLTDSIANFKVRRRERKLDKGLPKYYNKLFDLINKKQNIVLDMDVGFAKKVIYDEMIKGRMVKGTTYKNKIHLPDFEALKADKKGLKEFIKIVMGNKRPSKLLNPHSIVALIDQHIEAEKKHSIKLHEAIHVATVEFMKANPKDPKTIVVNNLYQKMLKLSKDEPSHPINSANGGYWKTNVKEFVAESLSHEVLIKELNKIPLGTKSILHRLLNTFRKMLGLTNDSATDVLLNTVLKMNDVKSPVNDYTQDWLKPSKGSVMEMNRVNELLGMVRVNANQGTNIDDTMEIVKFFGTTEQFLVKVGKTEAEFMNHIKETLRGKPLPKSEMAIDSKTRTELAKIPNTLPLMYSNDTSKSTKKALFINVKNPVSPTETYLNEYFKTVKPTDKFLNGLTPKELLDGVKGIVDTSLVNSTRVSIVQYNDIRDTTISVVAGRFLDGKALTDDIIETISKSESSRKDVSITRDKDGTIIKLNMSETETKNKNSKSTTETTVDESDSNTSENNKSSIKKISRATSSTEDSNIETNEIINKTENSDGTSKGNSSTAEYDIDETHSIKNSKIVINRTTNVSGTSTSEYGGGDVTHESGTIKQHYILENSLQIETLITNGSIKEEQRASAKPMLDELLSTDTSKSSITFEYKGTSIDVLSFDGVNYSFTVHQEGKDTLHLQLQDGILTKVWSPTTSEMFSEFEKAMNTLGASYLDFDSDFTVDGNQKKHDLRELDKKIVKYNKNTFNGEELSKDLVITKIRETLSGTDFNVPFEAKIGGTEYYYSPEALGLVSFYFRIKTSTEPELVMSSKTEEFVDIARFERFDPDTVDLGSSAPAPFFKDIGIDLKEVADRFSPSMFKAGVANWVKKTEESKTDGIPQLLDSIDSESSDLKYSDGTGRELKIYSYSGKLVLTYKKFARPTVTDRRPTDEFFHYVKFDTNTGLQVKELLESDTGQLSKNLSESNLPPVDVLMAQYREAIKKKPKDTDSELGAGAIDTLPEIEVGENITQKEVDTSDKANKQFKEIKDKMLVKFKSKINECKE
jgi:hypothetical protein